MEPTAITHGWLTSYMSVLRLDISIGGNVLSLAERPYAVFREDILRCRELVEFDANSLYYDHYTRKVTRGIPDDGSALWQPTYGNGTTHVYVEPRFARIMSVEEASQHPPINDVPIVIEFPITH